MKYPFWLKCLIAFGAPASATLMTTYSVKPEWTPAIIAAIAAGFGGLAGLGINDTAKASVETSIED